MYHNKYRDDAMKKKNLFKISSIVIRLLIFLFIVGTMIYELFKVNYYYAFICFFSCCLVLLLEFILKKYHLKMPNILKILLYLFILGAGILGEVYHFYIIFPYWDIIIHLLSGFLGTAISLSLIKHYFRINNISLFVIILAISVSLMIGVFWEFKEYITDKLLITDEQKDTLINKISSISLDGSKNYKPVKVYDIEKIVLYNNDEIIKVVNGGYLDIGLNDTMTDLMLDLGGSIVCGLLMYFSSKSRKVLIVIKR